MPMPPRAILSFTFVEVYCFEFGGNSSGAFSQIGWAVQVYPVPSFSPYEWDSTGLVYISEKGQVLKLPPPFWDRVSPRSLSYSGTHSVDQADLEFIASRVLGLKDCQPIKTLFKAVQKKLIMPLTGLTHTHWLQLRSEDNQLHST